MNTNTSPALPVPAFVAKGKYNGLYHQCDEEVSCEIEYMREEYPGTHHWIMFDGRGRLATFDTERTAFRFTP